MTEKEREREGEREGERERERGRGGGEKGTALTFFSLKTPPSMSS